MALYGLLYPLRLCTDIALCDGGTAVLQEALGKEGERCGSPHLRNRSMVLDDKTGHFRHDSQFVLSSNCRVPNTPARKGKALPRQKKLASVRVCDFRKSRKRSLFVPSFFLSYQSILL